MANKTSIEWTDATWNPIRGCSRVSEGCRNCYAETIARRFVGPGLAFEGLTTSGKWNGQIKFVEKRLLDPLKWKTPRRIFVNSMSDLFHENVTDEMLDKIFAVMALCPQHTFQVLTKRPERMLAYLMSHGRTSMVYNAATPLIGGDFSKMSKEMAHHRSSGDGWWPLPNVWLGVSVENQKAADERIPLLLETPAAVRFLSVEPLLGPVDSTRVHDLGIGPEQVFVDALEGFHDCGGHAKVDWVIVGGESGPGARPMHPDWARSLRDQCVAAGVPFFFKQWGEWGAGSVHLTSGERVFRQFESYQQWTHKGNTWINGGICLDATGKQMKNGGDMKAATYPVMVIHRVGKKAAGDLLDGVQWHQFPEVSA